MLRPVVAATNCSKAGKTSGLDIGRRRPVAGRNLNGRDLHVTGPQSAQAGGDRQRDAENSVIARPRLRSADSARRRSREPGGSGIFWPGLDRIPDKTLVF